MVALSDHKEVRRRFCFYWVVCIFALFIFFHGSYVFGKGDGFGLSSCSIEECSVSDTEGDVDIDGVVQEFTDRELEREFRYLKIKRMLIRDEAYIYLIEFPKDVVVKAPSNLGKFGMGLLNGGWGAAKDAAHLGADLFSIFVLEGAELFGKDWREYWKPNSPLTEAIMREGAWPVIKQIPRGMYESIVEKLLSGNPEDAGEATVNMAMLLAPLPKGVNAIKTFRPVTVAGIGEVFGDGTATMAEVFTVEGEFAAAAEAAGISAGTSMVLAVPYFEDKVGDIPSTLKCSPVMEGRLGAIDRKISAVGKELKDIDREYGELSKKWDDVTEEVDRLKGKRKEIEEELRDIRNDKSAVEDWFGKVSSLKKRLSEVNRKLKELKERSESLFEDLEGLENKKDSIKVKLESLAELEAEEAFSAIQDGDWTHVTYHHIKNILEKMRAKASLHEEECRYLEARRLRNSLVPLEKLERAVRKNILDKLDVEKIEQGLVRIKKKAFGPNDANGELERFLSDSGLSKIGFKIVTKRGGKHNYDLYAPLFDKEGNIVGHQKISVVAKLKHPDTAADLVNTIRAALGKLGVERYRDKIFSSKGVVGYHPFGNVPK